MKLFEVAHFDYDLLRCPLFASQSFFISWYSQISWSPHWHLEPCLLLFGPKLMSISVSHKEETKSSNLFPVNKRNYMVLPARNVSHSIGESTLLNDQLQPKPTSLTMIHIITTSHKVNGCATCNLDPQVIIPSKASLAFFACCPSNMMLITTENAESVIRTQVCLKMVPTARIFNLSHYFLILYKWNSRFEWLK